MNDEKTLKIEKSDTRSELATAHMTLRLGRNSLSGLHNIFSQISYKFFAAIALTELENLSDALVGRIV
jgi:hypothetical protein